MAAYHHVDQYLDNASKPTQECVRQVSTTTGLLVEMDVFTATLERMCALLAWQHPQVLVVRYEDLWADPNTHFRYDV